MTMIARTPAGATITLAPEQPPGSILTVWRGSCCYDDDPEPGHENWGMTYPTFELAMTRATERYGPLDWSKVDEVAA